MKKTIYFNYFNIKCYEFKKPVTYNENYIPVSKRIILQSTARPHLRQFDFGDRVEFHYRNGIYVYLTGEPPKPEVMTIPHFRSIDDLVMEIYYYIPALYRKQLAKKLGTQLDHNNKL